MNQTSNELYAALDLGSNSFHLLIARFDDDKLVIVDRHKEMVRLASGLQKNGRISDEVAEKAFACLTRISERIRPIAKDHIRVVGTNTLRVAKHSDAFLAKAESILNVPINIISGIEEARLIFLGISRFLSPTTTCLVVDIGGGSTELAVGKGEPRQLESLYMGCVSFTKRYFKNGVITKKNYNHALVAASSELQSLSLTFAEEDWSEVVGCSGTIRAIETVLSELGLISNHQITPEALEQLAKRIIACKQTENLDFPGLSSERKPVFAGGVAILQAVFAELDIAAMHTSGYAIREGVIFDLAGRLHNKDRRVETVSSMMSRYSVDRDHAWRVGNTANRLLKQLRSQITTPYHLAKRSLFWAIDLHEIGLTIAHSGYQKHSAYLVENSDMPGFSRQEQKLISFLILNHRRKLKVQENSYGFNADWALVMVMRIACLLHRKRNAIRLPDYLTLDFNDTQADFHISEPWLAEHPLTEEDLNQEIRFWKKIGITLKVNHPPLEKSASQN